MRRRTIAAIAPIALVGLLAGCGGDDEAGTSPAGATSTTAASAAEVPDLSEVDFDDQRGTDEVAVTVRDNTFAPQYIEVDPGTTVVFTNRGRTEHNVLPVVDGAFDAIEVDDLEPTEVASITFDEPGEYPYYCSLHGTTTKGMVGAVRVLGE